MNEIECPIVSYCRVEYGRVCMGTGLEYICFALIRGVRGLREARGY